MQAIKELIRTVPNYPKQGVMFRDITTLLKDANGFRKTINVLVDRYRGCGISKVVAIEARGFIMAAPLALELAAGFVPVRKMGKLPAERIGHEYDLEYGTDVIEIHVDAITPEDVVLVVDDLIATGGTALAAVSLVGRLGGRVHECAFLVDLPALGGRARLEKAGLPVFALCEYA